MHNLSPAPGRVARLGPRSAHGAFRRSSALRGGLAVLVAGALLDAGHHTGVGPVAAEQVGYAGHLVTFAGMALVAGAAALAGLRRG